MNLVDGGLTFKVTSPDGKNYVYVFGEAIKGLANCVRERNATS